MLTEFLQDQATAFASGSMAPEEREVFELVLEFHQELREFVGGLHEAGAALMLAGSGPAVGPSPGLKGRIVDSILAHPQQTTSEALVMSGPDGLVQWVNSAFSAMCGYPLEELQGKRLGPILQGVGTDRATADRMRQAVRENRPCRETILNYHKNGTPYWVDVAITPILDAEGRPMWLVARERELPDGIAA